MTTVGGELIERHRSRIIGRATERAALLGLLRGDGPRVAFVHGIAGVGKSTLVRAFAGEARALGATVIPLDCGAMEPTERGLLSALGAAVGDAAATLDGVVARLSTMGDPVVLVLDGYELVRALEPWLYRDLVPALSPGVRLVLAGREAPMTGWTTELGPLFRPLPLGSLSSSAAAEMLRDAGVASADAERIDRVARGHPLSLMLAAAALRDRPELTVAAATVTAIVGELTRLYLGGLDPLTRRALDAASVVRRPTRSLLAAMLPETAPGDTFDRIRALPFVELGDDGLVLHETVREAVAALLRSVDPEGSRRYRAAAWRCLRDEARRAPDHEMWRTTADLLYILQNPVVREAFFPTTEHVHVVDAATPQDGAAILAITARHELADSTALIANWWRELPNAFRVVRDRSGTVAGFHILAEADQVSRRLAVTDPVTGRWWEHIRRFTVPPGDRILFNRLELARDHAEAPSPVQAAIWLDIKRRYMELRPHLRRVYTVFRDAAALEPLGVLGFRPLPGGPVLVDGLTYHTGSLDFGPGSVDGWLARLVAAELDISGGFLDVTQRQLVIDGRRVGLTTLEFKVLDLLQQREGRVVDRATLLRDVWGQSDQGGSNVTEAIIRSLRRKLGERAGMIETVRGLGYRFTAVEALGTHAQALPATVRRSARPPAPG